MPLSKANKSRLKNILKWEDKQRSTFFLLGALSLVSSLIFRLLAIDFHVWFNRDDAGHIFMIMASFCFYRGIKVYESEWIVDAIHIKSK